MLDKTVLDLKIPCSKIVTNKLIVTFMAINYTTFTMDDNSMWMKQIKNFFDVFCFDHWKNSFMNAFQTFINFYKKDLNLKKYKLLPVCSKGIMQTNK